VHRHEPDAKKGRSGFGGRLSIEVRDVVPIYVHLLRANDLIDRDYTRQLDVATLALEAQPSTAHSARRRIERAKQLLRGTDLSITEISLEVGCQSLGSFSTAFRELVGMTPSEYGRHWRDETIPPIPACFTLMNTRPVERHH
jgi:AraC-like DNA-binding protein